MKKTIRTRFSQLVLTIWKSVPMPGFVRKLGTTLTNKKFMVAVQGIILNDKGEILLLRHTYRKIPWGIPSGWLAYEQPESGLQREVFEETGFHIKVEKVGKTTFFTNIYGVRSVDILLIGKFVGGTFAPSPEVSKYMFCKIGAWPDGMRDDQKALIYDVISNQ